MNQKQFYIVLIILIILVALVVSSHYQISKMELRETRSILLLQNFDTTINIDKVEGNGNSFGDNNQITNNKI